MIFKRKMITIGTFGFFFLNETTKKVRFFFDPFLSLKKYKGLQKFIFCFYDFILFLFLQLEFCK